MNANESATARPMQQAGQGQAIDSPDGPQPGPEEVTILGQATRPPT